MIQRLLFVFLLSVAFHANAQEQPPRLWYAQPAAKWTHALPIGNGRLGAMIYGGVSTDYIQFNEETLWTGRPRSHNRPGAVKYLETIRGLLANGQQEEAERLAGIYFMGLKDPEDSTYARLRADWLKKVLPGEAPAALNFDDSRWSTMQMPTPDGFERNGLDGLDGVVWFRTSFELPANWQGKEIVFGLGRIRDMDVTYVNGVKVGSSEGINNDRNYVVKSSQLKPGQNILAIQVVNFYDKGGLTGIRGSKQPFKLYPVGGGDTIGLPEQWKYFIQHDSAPAFPRYEADYQPFGDLYLSFPDAGNAGDYHRELDITNAIAKTSYTSNGVKFTREYFASNPHQSIIVRITADKPGSIDCIAMLKTLHRKNAVKKLDNRTSALTLQVMNGALNGAAFLHATNSGGNLTVNDSAIVCRGADTLTFILVAATNFNNYRDVSGNALNRCTAYLQKIKNSRFAALKSAHIKDYQQYFNRFSLILPEGENAKMPTDLRLRRFTIEKDPTLISLYLQYGRYLLLSASRPGTQPANLQGIWNNLLTPPWGSKYTSNINVEMNYWPSDLLNLGECQQPLFKMITELAEAGKQTAKEYYGAPGWVLHHNTDLWRGTAAINASNHGIWTTGAAWMCQHLWDHYLFTQDKKFLQEYYPIMREAAAFFVHHLVKDAKTGWLISTPSNSPEQGGLVAGPAMDHQIIRELFKNCVQAAAILKTDAVFAATLQNKLTQLAPDQIGKHGQLQEWLEDKDDTSNRHRHVSHLWAVYPGAGITWNDPALMKAARQSLIYRGDGGTGWSLAWKVNLWARFKDGDHTLKMIKALLEPAEGENGGERGGAYNNLFDAHPPFQIDGNFGGAAGIAEMFVQSHERYIELLPALPTALPTGNIKGVRARGGFVLDIQWHLGKLNKVRILSETGNTCTVRYKEKEIRLATQKGKTYTLSADLVVARMVADSTMQRVYSAIKTPHKYGLVLIPEDDKKMMDCPAVFRKDNSWYMTYIVFDGKGYETWLAKSADLLQWKTLGRMMSFSSDTNAWDGFQKAGYIALQDPQWGGSYAWQPFNNKYWMSYFGGNAKGYEAGELSAGIAWTSNNPATPHEWQRTNQPILTAKDTGVRWWENRKIFKSSVIWDKQKTTGYPFVMYYNANGDTAKNNLKTRWYERIGMAVSNDMIRWRRFGIEPVMHHPVGITGDAVIQKMGDLWVMFYFGAFWEGRKDAFNRFACSYDLVHWTDWTGVDLVAPTESFDQRFAHKPFVIKYNGVVYHFYCAVNDKDQRGIAVATSKDLGKSKLNAPAQSARTIIDFNNDWQFHLFDTTASKEFTPENVREWRTLDLPHDWSIEGSYSESNRATIQGGALPGGIALYRKTFSLPANAVNKNKSVEFDGVYQNSEVWINGKLLGKRPNGYTSFQYDLTPYTRSGSNVLTVKVDNSAQPNSRWYTGSGIYRNVRLVMTNKIAVDHWGTFITTPNISQQAAGVQLSVNIRNTDKSGQMVRVETRIYNAAGKMVTETTTNNVVLESKLTKTTQQLVVPTPRLWSTDDPYLYKAVTKIIIQNKTFDEYITPFGIRYFHFDAQKGFSLNGKPLKILGVCNHHDLGPLGAAINTRAMERQLEILKAMGCNAIRTAHNPPAPELLDLCDKMGFLVMDESFDVWKKRKNRFDYHLEFDTWHRHDLEDMVRRDRNHPSVFMWSIGNEIREQFDSTGIRLTRELAQIVKLLDTTRPVTAALTETDTLKNFMYQADALDVIGLNYNHAKYDSLPWLFPGKKIVASETTSGLASRGHYDMPSDSLRYWPARGDKVVKNGNADWTVSAYDNVAAYWGSTHETSWKGVKKNDFLSGIFVWTGFDYLGEPTPYPWPARSSYFGIIDLAGFPKDVYYMYQSEWTNKPVLHIFPHWNWTPGKKVDVWAYYNNADEVELFLNDRSLGIRKKQNDDLHVQWAVSFEPGTLKAVSRKNGKTVLQKTIKTAGAPSIIKLTADRKILHADGKDLSFITVQVTDAEGNLVPGADNLVNFEWSGPGKLSGVENGNPASSESSKAAFRKAYKGLCLAIMQTSGTPGAILLTAKSPGLVPATIALKSR